MSDPQQQEHDFPFIGQPALQALTVAGYTRLDQLTDVTEAELASLHGMGPKALRILGEALAERGLAYKPPAFPRISQPAMRALASGGYTQLEQLAGVPESEVANLHGMGPQALGILRDALAERGLSFANEG